MIKRNVADVLAEYRRLPENEQQAILRKVAYYNQLSGSQRIAGDLGYVGALKIITLRHTITTLPNGCGIFLKKRRLLIFLAM